MVLFMVFSVGSKAENSDTMRDESEQSWYQRTPFMVLFQDRVGVIKVHNHAKLNFNMA